MLNLKQLTEPTAEQIADLLNLFKEIPGRTCSAANYLEYLDRNWQNIALFVALEDEKVVGFTHAERPSLLEPKIGWLPFSYNSPLDGHQTAVEAFRMAMDWLRALGATSVRMTSVRSPRALKKAHGWTLCAERLYEKEIPQCL